MPPLLAAAIFIKPALFRVLVAPSSFSVRFREMVLTELKSPVCHYDVTVLRLFCFFKYLFQLQLFRMSFTVDMKFGNSLLPGIEALYIIKALISKYVVQHCVKVTCMYVPCTNN